MAEGKVQLLEFVGKDSVSNTIRGVTKNIDAMTKALEEEAAKVIRSAKQYDVYKAVLAGATHQQIDHIRSLHDQINAAKQADIVNKAHTQALIENARRTQMATAAGKGMNQQLRFMRGGFGQVGHQIQDIAVQLQMGQNAMLVFGQQGSQIASLFGHNGAVIGAVLAVGAAVAVGLAPAFFGATDAIKAAEKKTEGLIDRFDELEGEMLALAKKDAAKAIEEQAENILDLENAIASARRELVVYNKIYESGFLGPEALLSISRGMARANETIEENTRLLIGARAVQEETIKNTDDRTKATEDLLTKMREEFEQLGMNSVELAEYAAKKGKANAADLAAVRALALATQARQAELDAVDEFNRKLDEELKSRAEEEKKIVEAERRKQESIENTLNRMREQNIALEEGAGAAAAFSMALQGGNAAQIEAARQLANTNEQLREQNKLKTEAAALAKKEFEDEVARQKKAAGDFDALGLELRGELSSPEEKLRQQLADRQAIIDEFAALGVAKEAEIHTMRLMAETAFNQQMKELAVANAQAQLSAMSTVLGSFQTQLSAMQGMVEEGSAIGKAFYVAQQGMAAAMAIIKGHEAGMNIYASMSSLGPVGVAMAPGMAAAAVAMGYAQAGMIVGQTLASFEGGGFTGAGARSGGVDGKGGFLATLHPNETVIDHTKGQGMAAPQNIRIVNAFDTSVIGDYIGSDAGEKMVMNVVKRNQQTLRSLVV